MITSPYLTIGRSANEREKSATVVNLHCDNLEDAKSHVLIIKGPSVETFIEPFAIGVFKLPFLLAGNYTLQCWIVFDTYEIGTSNKRICIHPSIYKEGSGGSGGTGTNIDEQLKLKADITYVDQQDDITNSRVDSAFLEILELDEDTSQALEQLTTTTQLHTQQIAELSSAVVPGYDDSDIKEEIALKANITYVDNANNVISQNLASNWELTNATRDALVQTDEEIKLLGDRVTVVENEEPVSNLTKAGVTYMRAGDYLSHYAPQTNEVLTYLFIPTANQNSIHVVCDLNGEQLGEGVLAVTEETKLDAQFYLTSDDVYTNSRFRLVILHDGEVIATEEIVKTIGLTPDEFLVFKGISYLKTGPFNLKNISLRLTVSPWTTYSPLSLTITSSIENLCTFTPDVDAVNLLSSNVLVNGGTLEEILESKAGAAENTSAHNTLNDRLTEVEKRSVNVTIFPRDGGKLTQQSYVGVEGSYESLGSVYNPAAEANEVVLVAEFNDATDLPNAGMKVNTSNEFNARFIVKSNDNYDSMSFILDVFDGEDLVASGAYAIPLSNLPGAYGILNFSKELFTVEREINFQNLRLKLWAYQSKETTAINLEVITSTKFQCVFIPNSDSVTLTGANVTVGTGTLDEALELKADIIYVDQKIAAIAPQTVDAYTKAQTDQKLTSKLNTVDGYTRAADGKTIITTSPNVVVGANCTVLGNPLAISPALTDGVFLYDGAGRNYFRARDKKYTSVGQDAIPQNATGSNVVNLGDASLFKITSAYNIANVGSGSFGNLTIGAGHAFLGNFCAMAMTSAIGCTGVGQNTLTKVTTSSYNSALGYSSGLNLTGQFNLTLGANSGSSLTLGDYNIFIGAQADTVGGPSVGSKNIIIGRQKDLGLLTKSNCVSLGWAPMPDKDGYVQISNGYADIVLAYDKQADIITLSKGVVFSKTVQVNAPLWLNGSLTANAGLVTNSIYGNGLALNGNGYLTLGLTVPDVIDYGGEEFYNSLEYGTVFTNGDNVLRIKRFGDTYVP